MRDDDLRSSSNVEDRRGMGGVARGGLGLGAVLVLSLIGWATGIDPSVLIGGAEMATQQAQTGQPATVAKGTPNDEIGRFAAKVLGETEDVWAQILPQQTGRQYRNPVLVLFSDVTNSGCGTAQSAMGPFYCPVDQKLYLDTAFFRDMQQKLGGGGQFAYAYVIAHEVGHHVQNLTGLLPKVQQAQQSGNRQAASDASVRTELMADCLAGVWAHHMNLRHQNIDETDIRQAVATASAIGDDRLARQSGRVAMPDSFTHGSSAQRVQWLTTGLRSGTVKACNTFGG